MATNKMKNGETKPREAKTCEVISCEACCRDFRTGRGTDCPYCGYNNGKGSWPRSNDPDGVAACQANEKQFKTARRQRLQELRLRRQRESAAEAPAVTASATASETVVGTPVAPVVPSSVPDLTSAAVPVIAPVGVTAAVPFGVTTGGAAAGAPAVAEVAHV